MQVALSETAAMELPAAADIMRQKILAAGKEFEALSDRVEKELNEQFFGTTCAVDVSDATEQQIQMLMWMYRQVGWVVALHVSRNEELSKMILRFHDPSSVPK